MKRLTSGFTIVEILIIIVVIGILASITVLSYNGIQQQAREAGIKADLETASSRLDRYRSEKGEFPPVGSDPDLALREANIEVQRSLYSTEQDTYLYCVSADGQRFAFVVKGVNNISYTMGMNRKLERIFEMAPGSHATVCNGLTGPNSGARLGYVVGTGWRNWSQ